VLTIGQLARTSPGSLESLLGHAVGQKLAALAWNRDPEVEQHGRQCSGFVSRCHAGQSDHSRVATPAPSSEDTGTSERFSKWRWALKTSQCAA
jgi:hypothetical protein